MGTSTTTASPTTPGVFIDTDGEGSFGGGPVVVVLNVDPGNLILDTNVLVTDV